MQIDERRFSPVQIRSAPQPGSRIVSGLAVRFGARSENLGGWKERIVKGAFTKTLSDGHDIRMLHSHDSGRILGSTRAGTLSLGETSDGLAFRCDLPNTSDGDDVLELCRRGDLREMSFGFRCDRERWEDEDDDDFEDYPDDRGRRAKKTIPVRHVLQATLSEVSAVGWPAYSNDATHIKLEPMAAAAAVASRSLFPSGQVPYEIRQRGLTPRRPMSDEEMKLYSAALLLETRADLLR
jgi:HK97 family phage prohead protease